METIPINSRLDSVSKVALATEIHRTQITRKDTLLQTIWVRVDMVLESRSRSYSYRLLQLPRRLVMADSSATHPGALPTLRLQGIPSRVALVPNLMQSAGRPTPTSCREKTHTYKSCTRRLPGVRRTPGSARPSGTHPRIPAGSTWRSSKGVSLGDRREERAPTATLRLDLRADGRFAANG